MKTSDFGSFGDISTLKRDFCYIKSRHFGNRLKN